MEDPPHPGRWSTMPIEVEHTSKGDVVELPREEFERLLATLEFLEDEELQEGVLRALRQYAEGKTRPWSEVREDL